jgi:diguanylate cyclase (GGDEF)-like protein|tara:strand:+ start:1479 stop:2678 length:1200 start_codon:yes stop_codon:yes gene_type:complete
MSFSNKNDEISSDHLQHQEVVNFLYERATIGMLITLFISSVGSGLAYLELSIQGREHWVLGWFVAFSLILTGRYILLCRFLLIDNKNYFPHQQWHNRFFIGVLASGIMQGCGAVLLMPYVTTNVQFILHSLLLGMGAGGIAYLSTSLKIYIAYLVTIMLPITIWLFFHHTLDGYILGFLYLFMMVAYSSGVKRMNILINDALYYRFDNAMLVDDLQRLISSISNTNKALEKISITDELTGASNYRAFRISLEEIWSQNRGSDIQVALVRLNIDYYHEYNAYYGSEQGDKNLYQVARILMSEISHKDQLLARLNGAEFAYILPNTSSEKAQRFITKVTQALKAEKIEHAKSRRAPYLTVSVGVSCQQVTSQSSTRILLAKADAALKVAKNKGHDRIEVIN